MDRPLPSEDVLEHVRAEVGLDEQRIKEAVQLMKDWLKLQPHLPNTCEDARLERWILRCKNSLERAKSSIDMYYTLKNVVPEFMMDRDPYSDMFRNATSVGCCVPLPHLTEDYCRVTVFRMLDFDPHKFDFVDIYKLMLMVQEVRMTEDYWSRDIVVFDCIGGTIDHAMKMTLPNAKKLEVICMKAFRARVKKIYFINVPTYIEIVVSFTKTIVKPKIAQRIEVISKSASNLCEKISPKILPVEYGGEDGSLIDHWSVWIKKLESYRGWFVEQDKFKSDESKRPGKAVDSGKLFGFEGSFRKLNVD